MTGEHYFLTAVNVLYEDSSLKTLHPEAVVEGHEVRKKSGRSTPHAQHLPTRGLRWEGGYGQVGRCEALSPSPAELTRLQPQREEVERQGDGGWAGNVLYYTPAGLDTSPSTPRERKVGRRVEGR